MTLRSSVRSHLALLGACLCAAVAGPEVVRAAGRQTPAGAAATRAAPAAPALVTQYCVGCHNQKLKTAGLALDAFDPARAGEHPEVWEKVVLKLQAGAMPPLGAPRPDRATYDSLVAWLEHELDRAADAAPNPGRTETFHRLNRSEYRNTIRDLLALDVDVTTLLPSDDTGKYGFDNVAEVLSVSPALLDRYLTAARKISRLAVGLTPGAPVVDTFNVPHMLHQDSRVSDDLPIGSQGGIAVRYTFPADGEYTIKVRLQRNYVDYIRGMGAASQVDVRLDGVRLKRFTIGGDAPGNPSPISFEGNILGSPDWETYMLEADFGMQLRVPVKAGTRLVGVSFLRKATEEDGVRQPGQVGFPLAINAWYDGNPAVDVVEIGGPYQPTGSGDTASRRRILLCRPQGARDTACARRIISSLARRAFRGQVTAEDMTTLMAFFRDGAGRPGPDGGFDGGIQASLERILADPGFLFRVERDPAAVAAGAAYKISDLELASRLSFFLWSSIPDDALLDAAARGTLSSPAVLERQVRRMLADGRSSALVDNFAEQWLYLRTLRDITPNPDLYPDFDDNLRVAFEQETKMFVESQLRGDRSVVDLLTADYTFVNERLARHYGIPNITGERFRRVALTSERRRGLMGQGAILAVTSYPTRTSPVLRGKWLLENILGTPPPPPPPNVPGLPEKGEGGKAVSVRERLERHRKNPVCASCHAQMDPLGFALENFDGIGAWRDKAEGNTAIDSSGRLSDGTSFEGLPGLRAVLVAERERFVRTVTEKLMSYGLGRGMQPYDMPAIRRIMKASENDEYRWSAIVLGIVKSPAFLMRRAADSERQGDRNHVH